MIFLKLFLTFFKIGAFTFGGGYAMLPLVQEEVYRQGWMSVDQLINFVAVSESTPGPFAINISTYVGMKTGGIFGAFAASLGVVLPSFIIILIVARFYKTFRKNRAVIGVMTGLKPTVVGLIGAAILTTLPTVFPLSTLSLSCLSNPTFWARVVIFAICLFLVFKKANPLIIIGVSALLGLAVGYFPVLLGFELQ